jgi:hypothetical protein
MATITVLDKRGIYRIVSSRTYGKDSQIYINKHLKPYFHSHKRPFNNKDEEILDYIFKGKKPKYVEN